MQVEAICDQFSTKPVDIKKSEAEDMEICPIIQKSLNKIIRNENYTSYKILNNSFSSNGGNFLGDLFVIDVKGESKDGSDKETNIFIKRISIYDSVISGMVNPTACYNNEVLFYREMLDIFNELYNEAGVPDEERLKTVKIYDCNEHVIALENVSRKGFKTLDRFDLMPLDFAVETMKELAKFHALSFVLEDKRHDVFEKTIRRLKPLFNLDNENNAWENFVVFMTNASFQLIEDTYQDKKEYLLNKVLDKMQKHMKGEIGEVKCICHGDFKLNNILVRKNGNGETETTIIDYQFLGYKSPVIDILFFLYTGSDLTFRKNHVDQIKDVYHNSLSKALQNFAIDVDKIYPRREFEKDFNDYIEYGLMVSVTILPMLLTDNPEIFSGDRMLGTPIINDRFKQRINDIMEEFTEKGVL